VEYIGDVSSEYILYGSAVFTFVLSPDEGRAIADKVLAGVNVGTDMVAPL